MTKKKTLLICLVCILSLNVFLFGCSNNDASQSLNMSIGTASMGGAYYPMGQENCSWSCWWRNFTYIKSSS